MAASPRACDAAGGEDTARMKYQLIPAVALAALMTLCGYIVTQLDAAHSDALMTRPTAVIEATTAR